MVYIVQNKKVLITKEDYTVAGIAFIIAMFFLLFIVRPGINMIVANIAEVHRLEEINAKYSKMIGDNTQVYKTLTSNIPAVVAYSRAVPERPDIYRVSSDILTAATSSGVLVKKTTISEVNLKDKSTSLQLKTIVFDTTILGSLKNAAQFIHEIQANRRLKVIKSYTLSTDKQQDKRIDPGHIEMRLSIETYYL